MKHLLISLFFSTIIFAIPSKNYDKWNVIQDNDIWIGYTETEFPWCKSKMTFENTVEEVLEFVEDVNNYYKIFESITFSSLDENDVVHIMVDYPKPFSDRDYIVKFELLNEQEDVIYRFNSVKNKAVHEDYVRLTNAAGEWRISPIGNNHVEVSYTWNGELKGRFPSWTLTRAWLKQGNEVMIGLQNQLSKGVMNEN